jgi:hypothetical protein
MAVGAPLLFHQLTPAWSRIMISREAALDKDFHVYPTLPMYEDSLAL